MKPQELTWGDVFAEVEADAQPETDRAALAAAFFADLREVVEAHNNKRLTWQDVFDVREAA